MKTVYAVFENGVFRPTEPVELPEHCQVEFVPRMVGSSVAEQIESLRETDPALASVYEVLARRHDSGQSDTAERHNEHQP
ncbi:MAG: antitoxin family protein [Pirellulales bacterium]